MTDLTKKVCLIGDFGVGKTSLVRRFVSNIFDDTYITTVGVRIETKVVSMEGGNRIKLVIWDIAGSDTLDSLQKNYLQGLSGYMLVADGTRRNTFINALALKARIDASFGAPPFQFLLNKADLETAWELTDADYQKLEEKGIDFRKSSALTGQAVEDAFEALAREIWQHT